LTPFYILEAIYVIVAFACGYYTFAEGENNRANWDRSRLFGLAACALWPVLLLILILPLSGSHRRMPNSQ
jgi:hypothetical protein